MMKGVQMMGLAVGVVMLSFAAGAATRLELPMPGGRRVETVDPAGKDRVEVRFDVPLVDIQQLWLPSMKRPQLERKWRVSYESAPQSGMPFVSFFNLGERNRLSFGSASLEWDTRIASRLNQERGVYEVEVTVAAGPGDALRPFKVTLDRRDVPWTAALADWRESLPYRKGVFPDAAWRPVYCTWYAAHATFDQDWTERTAEIAAGLGFGTFILDDGWSYDDRKRASPATSETWYQDIGQWTAFSRKKFPDFRAHRERMRKLGLKYVVWVGPFMIGTRTEAYRRWGFDKNPNVKPLEGNVFTDITNREQMESVTRQLETLLRDNDLDGLKIDYINYIAPSVDKPRAGATRVFLEDLMARLRKSRPDAMFEFCEGYSTPYTASLATQFRSEDVPFEWLPNLLNLAQIRLALGDGVPIHSDPIFWAEGETDDNIDRHFMASMAGVPMLSMDLMKLSEKRRETVRRWTNLYAKRVEKFHRQGHWSVVYRNGALAYVTSVLDDEVFVIAADPAAASELRAVVAGKRAVVFNLGFEPLDLGVGRVVGAGRAN